MIIHTTAQLSRIHLKLIWGYLMKMSELPEIVHEGMTLEFEGFGTIIVGDFSNNGTNAAIHHCGK